MKMFGMMANRHSGLHEQRIPGQRLARLNQSLKRRLDDDIEDVFNRACAANDLEAATDLLSVLEKWYARRSARHGRERRVDDAALARARRELERLRTLQATRAAPPDTRWGTPTR